MQTEEKHSQISCFGSFLSSHSFFRKNKGLQHCILKLRTIPLKACLPCIEGSVPQILTVRVLREQFMQKMHSSEKKS